MLKLYEEQKHSIYEIQKMAGLNKYTLYKYINGNADITNMKISTLKKIAEIEKVDPFILLEKMKKYKKDKKI